jgi:flagellar basal-body rod protein FlgF
MMLRGMYDAASGMAAQLDQYQVHASNLANVNTTGFRRAIVAVRAFRDDLSASLGLGATQRGGATADGQRLDLAAGPVQSTGNPLDLALDGPGMFVVQTPAGERYTRAGDFSVSADGRLVTTDGLAVLGEGGPIVVRGSEVTVTGPGVVTVDGRLAGRLRLVEPAPQAQFSAVGRSLLAASAVVPASQTKVLQGCLEGANARSVEELTAMMRGARSYEANSQALRAQDEALGELVRAAGAE